VFILQYPKSLKKQLPNCLKRAETDTVLSVLDVRAYIVNSSASLDMNQVPEKLYLDQNVKQYVMKEAVIYKILRYRQNRCHTNEERWTDHSWHKAKIQHHQQCQYLFTMESQDNIPDCTKTHTIKTALPISLPGVKKLVHNINTHRFCTPKTIKLYSFSIFWFWATWWRLFQKRSCALNLISTF
jgi:hypothetical protein